MKPIALYNKYANKIKRKKETEKQKKNHGKKKKKQIKGSSLIQDHTFQETLLV